MLYQTLSDNTDCVVYAKKKKDLPSGLSGSGLRWDLKRTKVENLKKGYN